MSLLRSARQAHEYGIDLLLRLTGDRPETGRVSLTGGELPAQGVALGLAAFDFSLEGDADAVGLRAQDVDPRLVIGVAFSEFPVFGFPALELVAQRIALLLETEDPRLQLCLFRMQLLGVLNELPQAGSERIEIFQHGVIVNHPAFK